MKAAQEQKQEQQYEQEQQQLAGYGIASSQRAGQTLDVDGEDIAPVDGAADDYELWPVACLRCKLQLCERTKNDYLLFSEQDSNCTDSLINATVSRNNVNA